MRISRVLVFDIWGDYAHFRKIWTTTSPLTYPFPPRTSLAGLIGAILGLEKNSYHDLFSKENSALGIRIQSPVKKVRMGLNLIDTKKGFYLWDIRGMARRAPILFEFIKDPKYRIYAWLRDEKKYALLRKYLEKHQSVYTPSLGISELISNFKFVGDFPVEIKEADRKTVIHSIIPQIGDINMVIEEGRKYGKEDGVPRFMDEDRKVKEYIDIFYEAEGEPLAIDKGNFYQIGGENVILF
jgi:CRISPR-associated protein Cas5h